MPYEGQTGTAPDGTRVVYRGGKVYPADQAPGPKAPSMSPQDATYLSGLREEAGKSLNTAQRGADFLQINKDTPTGGMAGWPLGIGGMVRDMRGSKDPKWAQMESINSAVAPGLRPPGSGSSSDKDVKFYTRGFTNTEVPYEANVETQKRLHGQSDHDSAHAAFLDSWYQHKGTLLGGEQAFSQYWAKKTGAADGSGMTVNLPGGGTAIVRPR